MTNAIQKTSIGSVASSPSFSEVSAPSETSPSPHAPKRTAKRRFLERWWRNARLDVAESVLRLRHLRGLSQTALARKLKTKQPAIARVESGLANVSLEFLERTAKALGATLRVDLTPLEYVYDQPPRPRWWEPPVVTWAVAELKVVETTQIVQTFRRLELGAGGSEFDLGSANVPSAISQVPTIATIDR
jgi:transcriptional regulator with XRE-family HTH domain